MKTKNQPHNTLPGVAAAVGLTAAMLSGTAAAAGGDTLATATLISALDYTDDGTTVGFNNDISTVHPSLSPDLDTDGPDVFYTFMVATGGSMTFTVTPQASYDVAIYLMIKNGISASTLIAADTGFAGAAESITASVVAGTTYYFGIDSFYAIGDGEASGTYSLTVTGSALLPTVPEPGTLGLLAMGALGAAGARRGKNAVGWRAHRGGKCRPA
jgi:hypothetical protein